MRDDVRGTTERATELSASHARRGQAAWYAVWTRSNFEHHVANQLAARGFSLFLPEMGARAPRSHTRRVLPLFPGYVFLHHALEKDSYLEVVKSRGVVRVLEGGWDRLTPIAEAEIEGIQRVVALGIPVSHHPHFSRGDRVRVIDGPLTGLEGFFVRDKQNTGRLVLSIDLLRTSVAVELESALVVPSEAA